MGDHWHKLENTAVQEWSSAVLYCIILWISFAIISDLNVLFPISQVTSEPGKICTFNPIFKPN